MIDLENLPQHPLIEQVVSELVVQCDTDSADYFRVLTAFYFSKVASNMRAIVRTEDRGDVPINCFAVGMAPSGFGKGKSIGYFEEEGGPMFAFRKRFVQDTFPTISDQNLWKLASEAAAINGTEEDDEKERLTKLYHKAGPYVPTMRSATAATITQLRGKLLMSSVGAITIQVDEIGDNLEKMGVAEALTVFFELYDKGHMEVSGTKNTDENLRLDDMDGCTPANILLYGTPSKLFNGGSQEATFMGLLEAGYARRCLFAWGEKSEKNLDIDPTLVYEKLVESRNKMQINGLKTLFAELADPSRHNWVIEEPRPVGYARTAYALLCKRRLDQFSPLDTVRRAEMEHRHWKALKLAGALAYIDEKLDLSMDHMLAAIDIVERSGNALEKILSRDPSHVRLAKYIALTGNEMTHADLVDALPFYPKSSSGTRKDMMDLARQWGHKNNVIIRTRYEDGIELFSGETLKETDLENIFVSYSDHQAYNFAYEPAPFDKLHILATQPDMHWCNHAFIDGHRLDDKTIPGFNLLAVDVDGGVTLDFVHEALSEYVFMTYTTKRHTPEEHRFRLLMPITHILEMGQEEYREFVDNFLLWLPFDSDNTSNQRGKKWLTNEHALVHYNEGKMLDPMPFIPKTRKNEIYENQMRELKSLGNLERWFAQKMVYGDRNNQMLRFALALVDSGMSLLEVETAVKNFNSKLSNSLPDSELRSTVLVTAARKIQQRSAA